MKPTKIPTAAESVRLSFRRACMTISREYEHLAKTFEAGPPPTSHEAAVAFVKARRKPKAERS